MKKKFHTSLFVFRRDLRVEDNTGLIFALKHSLRVVPAFIFTEEQIEDNPFRSDHCLKFMLECLEDLQTELKQKGGTLYFFKGAPEKVVKRCIQELAIEAVIVNRDYTPYSTQRDLKIEKGCKTHGVDFFSFDDALLHPPVTTLKKNGKPYTVFTPYFRNASKQAVLPPTRNLRTNYFRGAISFTVQMPPKPSIQNELKGGRKEALKILKQGGFHSTHLSPYLKFTVCSPREAYKAISNSELIRSLYWRDFFTMIAFFFPHVFQGAFYPKFDRLKWSYNKKAFRLWCEGKTGFPIVDAGMRHMNATGFMPNRIRMIVASFLVKDLKIHWRWGEKYFAQTLIDYDPSVNNGNWQWVASTGCDRQPYFRIFNPWRQQQKFDPECEYIKTWVPELRPLPPKKIHEWYKKEATSVSYPEPLIDHEKAATAALIAYRAVDLL